MEETRWGGNSRPLAAFLHTEGIEAHGHYNKASSPASLMLGKHNLSAFSGNKDRAQPRQG